jgi:hypothetical protein
MPHPLATDAATGAAPQRASRLHPALVRTAAAPLGAA